MALALASPAFAQTMYRCDDGGRTIYSDKPCLNGIEVKQLTPLGNPTSEQLARARMKERANEQRAMTAAKAERAATDDRLAKCVKGGTAQTCAP